MEIKIKKLFTLAGSPFVLDPNMTYPTITGNESNFLTDYSTNKAQFDRYFIKEHGEKTVDIDGDSEADIVLNWKSEIQAIQRIYLEAWAHIYYTLNIAYNPVYNVEEHITTQYGAHETEREYGAHETEFEYGAHETEREYGAHETEREYGAHETEREYGAHETEFEYGAHETETEYGATSDTLGTHTDTRTNYAVSFDSALEKETGKTSDVIGSQTNTSLTHTDTETSKLHTDTETSKIHTDTETSKLHTDTETSKLHTDTETSKLHTDTTTSKLHTDTETSKLHTDTVDRSGNIGIKSASALADEETLLREKQIFFKNIFLTISREVGAYYDYNII